MHKELAVIAPAWLNLNCNWVSTLRTMTLDTLFNIFGFRLHALIFLWKYIDQNILMVCPLNLKTKLPLQLFINIISNHFISF